MFNEQSVVYFSISYLGAEKLLQCAIKARAVLFFDILDLHIYYYAVPYTRAKHLRR